MDKTRKIEKIIRKVSFAEAEETDLEYYAGLNWKESAAASEELRKMSWPASYLKEMTKVGAIGKLKDDRDDIE